MRGLENVTELHCIYWECYMSSTAPTKKLHWWDGPIRGGVVCYYHPRKSELSHSFGFLRIETNIVTRNVSMTASQPYQVSEERVIDIWEVWREIIREFCFLRTILESRDAGEVWQTQNPGIPGRVTQLSCWFRLRSESRDPEPSLQSPQHLADRRPPLVRVRSQTGGRSRCGSGVRRLGGGK